MLIDDDSDDREIFGEAVYDIGSSIIVETAWSASNALEKLNAMTTSLPDIIFLDINMPIVSGWDCLTLLKQDPALSSVPVVMFSTSAHEKEKLTAQQMGAAGLMTKRSSYESLKAHLRAIIDYFHGGELPAGFTGS